MAGGFGALDGLLVIDLTRVLGGPYCTQILGDNGAEVIKIEPPQGDEVRDWGPPFDQDQNASYFLGVNRNKRSLGLDLARPEGRDVLLRLLEKADVLIENFKPGAMEAWGLGYQDVLSRRFPSLVHCRISGFGSDGPMGGMPGYDAVVQAMCGMFSVNGSEASGPIRMGIPLVDIGTGLYSAIAILMALFERARSGQGQYVDLTLYDCGISLLHPHIANVMLSGRLPKLTGNAHPNICPYDCYPTRTVDVFLAVGNDRAFRRMAEVLEAPDLEEDSRFRTNGERLTHRPALTERLRTLFAAWDGDQLCERLLAVGVPAGPVRDVGQVLADAHTQHRGMAVDADGYKGFGLPIKFSRTPGAIRRKPPRFGADARKILASFAFDEDEVERLTEAGIVVEQRRA